MSSSDGGNILAYILVATLLLVAVVTQLAASGKIRRNGFVGIRISPTMASDNAWTAGHRAARLPGWLGFAAISITAVVAQFVPVPDIVFYVMLLLILAASLIAAWRGARSAGD